MKEKLKQIENQLSQLLKTETKARKMMFYTNSDEDRAYYFELKDKVLNFVRQNQSELQIIAEQKEIKEAKEKEKTQKPKKISKKYLSSF